MDRSPHGARAGLHRSEEHTSELQSPCNLVCRLLLEKKEMPLHIGSVSICDGALPFAQFVASIERKLDRLPRYRQKAVRLFFFNDPPTTEIYPLSLHDALPIYLVQPDSESYKSLLDEYTHLAPAEGAMGI